jgi:hypothetical protein
VVFYLFYAIVYRWLNFYYPVSQSPTTGNRQSEGVCR